VGDPITSITSRIRNGEIVQAAHAASSSLGGTRLLVIGAHALLPLPVTNLTYDVQDEFDAILVMDGAASELGELRKTSSNPLAPVICAPRASLAHCDFTLDEVTVEALMQAAAKVRPITMAVASLPKLPFEAHREALALLGLAFTRGVDIEARWAPDRPEMVSYPLLWSCENTRDLLEELADAKLLRRVFFDCAQYCPRCKSSRLIAREVCTSCGASHLDESSLVHHYRCSYQGPQSSFHRGESGLICPKCDHTLRHYGVDYDKPGTVITCASCTASMSDPAVKFVCVDCGANSPGETVGKQNWYSYSLLPDGIAALRAGRLPHRELSARSTSQNVSHPVRDFRLLLDQMLPIAKRHGRSLSAWRLKIDFAAVTQSLGPEAARKVRDFVQEIVVEGLRASDFTATLPDGIVACLPETSTEGTRVIIEAVRQRIAATISVSLKIEFSVFDLDDIPALLESLS
jgi:hypothetical protein